MRKFRFMSFDSAGKMIHVSDAETPQEHKRAVEIYPENPTVTVINFGGNYTAKELLGFANTRKLTIV